MAGLTVKRVPAPTMGMDAESAPQYVKAQHAPDIVNFVPGKAGRLAWSDGTAQIAAGSAVTSQYYGAWTYDDLVVAVTAGTRTVFGVSEGPIATIDATFPSYARVRDLVYGVGRVSPGVGAYYSMDSAGVITKMLNCPGTAYFPAAVASWNDRLFVLGVNPELNWSDVGGPTLDTAAQWQDDVTGLDNHITLDGDRADYGVGLARVGRSLLILRRRSAYLMTGDSPQSYSVQRVSAYGCSDPGTVLEYGGGVFYQSDEGVVFFNGSTSTMVSRAINSLIPQLLPGGLGVSPGGSACALSGEYVLFLFADGLGTIAPFVLHEPTGAWVRVQAGVDGFAHVGRTLTRPFVISTKRVLYDAAKLVQLPPTGTSTQRGPGTITTGVIELGSPVEKARLHRIMVDYVAAKLNSGAPATNLAVTVWDELGNTIAGPIALPGDLLTTRKRAVIDCFAEVESIQLTFTVSTGKSVEVHDTWVEYQAAQHRTG